MKQAAPPFRPKTSSLWCTNWRCIFKKNDKLSLATFIIPETIRGDTISRWWRYDWRWICFCKGGLVVAVIYTLHINDRSSDDETVYRRRKRNVEPRLEWRDHTLTHLIGGGEPGGNRSSGWGCHGRRTMCSLLPPGGRATPMGGRSYTGIAPPRHPSRAGVALAYIFPAL